MSAFRVNSLFFPYLLWLICVYILCNIQLELSNSVSRLKTTVNHAAKREQWKLFFRLHLHQKRFMSRQVNNSTPVVTFRHLNGFKLTCINEQLNQPTMSGRRLFMVIAKQLQFIRTVCKQQMFYLWVSYCADFFNEQITLEAQFTTNFRNYLTESAANN